MRFKQFLKEEAVKSALNIDEPEVGRKYDEEAVKKRIEQINKALKELRGKDMDDAAKEAMMADLNDKLDKWENVDRETKPPKPVPPPEEKGDGEAPPPGEEEADAEAEKEEEEEAEDAEKEAEEEEEEKDKEVEKKGKEEEEREKKKAKRKEKNAMDREKLKKEDTARIIKSRIMKL